MYQIVYIFTLRLKSTLHAVNCLKGNCTCDKGYGGSDCSFDVSSPPTITKLSDDGICDKSEETCEDITLYGHYFLENMETQCFMTREEVFFLAHLS